MKKFISYPKIGQFRNTVNSVKKLFEYEGDDENGEPIYNEELKKPIIRFTGTVKLDGTNASVCYNSNDGVWAQSRARIIEVRDDNYGFAAFVDPRRKMFRSMIDYVAAISQTNLKENTVCLHGEWAGKGIQKRTGICGVNRIFYLFAISITNHETGNKFWLDYSKFNLSSIKSGVLDLRGFGVFQINIDFNSPENQINRLEELTKGVEDQCPVAHAFGVEGIGEGIVWTGESKGVKYSFKTKGDKHVISRPKKKGVAIAPEKQASIDEFVKYSVTENRLDQAIVNTKPYGEQTPEKLGDVIKWIQADIADEEADVLVKSELTWKDVGRAISRKIVKMYQ